MLTVFNIVCMHFHFFVVKIIFPLLHITFCRTIYFPTGNFYIFLTSFIFSAGVSYEFAAHFIYSVGTINDILKIIINQIKETAYKRKNKIMITPLPERTSKYISGSRGVLVQRLSTAGYQQTHS